MSLGRSRSMCAMNSVECGGKVDEHGVIIIGNNSTTLPSKKKLGEHRLY
jgi:hypothetical protein